MFVHVRSACRLFAKSPGFTAVAVLTLMVAIGVNSAIFSLVDNVLLRSGVPVRPREVVCVFTASQDAARTFRQFSYAEFTTLRQSREPFADVAALNFNQVSLGAAADLRRALAFMVSDNYFSLMGVRPAAGRFFLPEETAPGAERPVVVAGYSLWQRQGLQPGFIGSTLLVNGRPHTVIGVTPEGFCGISALVAPEVWLPFGLFADISPAFGAARRSGDLAHPQNYTLNLVGRLKPGLTIARAQPYLPALAARLTALQPPAAARPRELLLTEPFSISPGPGDARPLRLMGLLLLAMSGLVLVIACLNLANMMLTRGAARAGEFAVRLALGATRRQIVSQILTEGLLLAGVGGALGLLLSLWANSLLQQYFSAVFAAMNYNLTARLQPDLPVIAVTFLFCLLATLGFSLGPALRAARADLVHDLKAQAGESAATGRWNRFFSHRHVLVMGQMALALVLVFAAGLFVRGAIKAGGTARDRGFNPAGVVLAELDFSLADTGRPEALRRALAALDRLRQLPGVRAAALSTLLPYNNEITWGRLLPAAAAPANQPGGAPARPGVAGIFTALTPDFFTSSGVPLLRGRDFTAAESREAGGRRVCIVDDGMAQKLFPGEEALGRHVRWAEPAEDRPPGEMEIVGIVARHSHGVEDLGRPVPGVFVPLAQAYKPLLFLTARCAVDDPAAVGNALAVFRRQLQDLDPDLPVIQMIPYADFIARNFTLWMVHLGAIMFGVFGGIALLLAVVGVYGVKAYAQERRTREIGIRMALGARRVDVLALMMKQGLQQTACAVGLGLVGCVIAGRLLAAVFFQVDALDPFTLFLTAALVSLATVTACWLPARRATKVDPLVALRTE